MVNNKPQLNPATVNAIDALVAKHPKCCGRDLMAAANRLAAGQPELIGFEVDSYLFGRHRPDCGMDCDEQCPVTGKPCRN